jgi:exopolysaccharide biosynthesis WecB/TagA/CpsF family protein
MGYQVRILFVTTYDMSDQSLGGASWVDRLLVTQLRTMGDVQVMTIASSDVDKDVPLEVSRSIAMAARTVQHMLTKAEPYQEAKFVWHRNWSAKQNLLIEMASQVDLIVSSQWPALLLTNEAGIRPDLHFAHNVDWVLSKLYDPLPFRLLRNGKRMKLREIDLLGNPCAVLTLSKSDAERLRSNGIFAHHLALVPDVLAGPATRTGNLGFIGKMSWPPNKMAVDNLLNRILPALNEKRERPAEVVLAGRGSEAYAHQPNVRALGIVDNVDQFYNLVDIVVIPRTGESTGISVKMLEAASHGKMVVAPTKLISDAGLSPMRAIPADDANEIVRKTDAWLRSDAERAGQPEQSDSSKNSGMKTQIGALLGGPYMKEKSVGPIASVWRDTMEKWVPDLDSLIDLAFDGNASARVQTVNLHHIYLAMNRSDFRRSIATADVLSADGWPIVSSVNRSSSRPVHRVTGSDFLVRLLSDPRIKNTKVAIIGGSQTSHELMATRLSEVGAALVYSNFGRKEDWDVEEISSELRKSNPSITLIAVTPPFGDLIANRMKEFDAPGFMIGIGGAIEMLLGIRRRAPFVVQRIRLEWAYRLIQDPRHLFRRYVLQCGPAYLRLISLVRETRRYSG